MAGTKRKYKNGKKGGTYKKSKKSFSYNKALVRKSKVEKNFVDLAPASYAANTTGSITLLATIPQGASQSQRIGKKVMMRSCQIRGECVADTTTATSMASLIIVYDKRPTGSLPAITDVLVSANANSMTNDVNSGRFKILRRINYSLNGNNLTAGQQTGTTGYFIDDFFKINKRAVYKAAATGAIGDIEEGAIYGITVGNQAAGTADANFNVGYRFRYTEE